MKKVALAAALAIAATAASAQSSVTLYGLVDAGVTYSNNAGGAHQFQATSGAVNQSRFGLKGSEDLGNGTKAVFGLEEGFDVMNGKQTNQNTMFGRQAYVGLSNNQLGTVTIGRQYATSTDFLGPLSLTGTQDGGALAAHPFNNDGLNTDSFSVNNSVKFTSNNYNGLQFGGQYGFSNATSNREYSLGASYQYRGLTASAGYLQLNNAGVNGGAVANNDAAFTAGRSQTYGAGVNYNFGQADAGVLVTQTRLQGATASNNGYNLVALTNGDARFTNYEVNGRYQLTPAVSVAGAYTFTDARIDGVAPKYSQVTVQTDYALSKRTDVYAQAEYQHVSNTGTSGITANINGLSASSTNSQVAATVGLRHRF